MAVRTPGCEQESMPEFLVDLLKWAAWAIVFGLLVWAQRRFFSR
jgi:hypothetical protein